MININLSKLKGSHIQLELLDESHRQKLSEAAQDESIWTYNSFKAYGKNFHVWFDNALQAARENHQYVFVVRRLSDNKILGSTRYYDVNPEHKRLTIGYTWYIPEVWGSYINPECKFPLLKFVFEDLQFNRIEFMTDARNMRSRAAIKKLGGVEEGVLRQHMVLSDGFVRDSVVFSIFRDDWMKGIKADLQLRLV